jgi:hypothetical protein
MVEKYIVLKCQRPLWVISGHRRADQRCPLCPQKRTFVSAMSMSALCQRRCLDRLDDVGGLRQRDALGATNSVAPMMLRLLLIGGGCTSA